MLQLIYATFIGIFATALLDLWALVARHILRLPGANWAMVGRWIGHFPRGRFVQDNIASTDSVKNEQVIGWIAHYFVGIFFAMILLLFTGSSWVEHPTLLPALIFGLSTILAPFLIMQPAMGAGIAASKTPNPASARASSIAAHGVFGLGLYGATLLLSQIL